MAGRVRSPAFFVPMKTLFAIISGLFFALLSAAEPRIVSLTPAVTETICFLGGESSLIGRSSACDFPAGIKHLPTAGDYTGFYLEQLLLLKPDFVIANNLTARDMRLKKHINAKIVVFPGKTIEDYIQSLETLGNILNRPEKGREEARKAALKLAQLKQSAAAKRNKSTAIWVIWHNPLLIAGPGSLPNTVMELAGLQNIAAGVKDEYFKASREWLAMQKPDYVIWTVNGVPFQAKGIWSDIREEQVISDLNPDILLRPGPRIFDGIEALKKRTQK